MNDSVCWNITNMCNKSCEYCFRELYEETQSRETNLGILDNLIQMGIKRITFSGGEPFMYPHLLELIKKAHDAGIKCYVVSNGSLLNESNIQECLEFVDKISFSCDSPRNYVNEQSGRGYDNYEHIKEILPIIRQYYPDILIDINTVVTYDPTGEYRELDYMMEAIRNELYSENINKWKIIRFYSLRGLAKECKETFDIPDRVFLEIKKEYNSRNGYIKIDVRDIEDIDKNLIVSPCGLLKESHNGEEYTIVDLKPAIRSGRGEKHV